MWVCSQTSFTMLWIFGTYPKLQLIVTIAWLGLHLIRTVVHLIVTQRKINTFLSTVTLRANSVDINLFFVYLGIPLPNTIIQGLGVGCGSPYTSPLPLTRSLTPRSRWRANLKAMASVVFEETWVSRIPVVDELLCMQAWASESGCVSQWEWIRVNMSYGTCISGFKQSRCAYNWEPAMSICF